MKKNLCFILLITFVFALPFSFGQKKNLTYQEAYGMKRPKVTKPLPRITGWLDDDHYLLMKTENKQRNVVKVEAVSGKESMY